MAEIRPHGLCDRRRRYRVSQAQSCHGIGLGGAVDQDKPVVQIRKLVEAYKLSVVNERTIYLVRDQIEVMLRAHVGNLSERLTAIDGSRGVHRVVEQDRLGAARDMVLQHLSGHNEITVGVSQDQDGLRTAHSHHFRVTRVARCGQDHLVPWSAKASHSRVQQGLRSGGDHHVSPVPAHASANSRLDIRRAYSRHIARLIRPQGSYDGLFPGLGHRKVHLTCRQIDDIPSGGGEGPGLGIKTHGHGWRHLSK